MLKFKRDLIPLDTTVLIDLGKRSDRTEGGIIFIDEYRDKNEMTRTEGTILKLGDGAFKEERERFGGISSDLVAAVGDKVCFKRYSGILFDCEATGNLYRIVQDMDIYAIERGEYVEVGEDEGKLDDDWESPKVTYLTAQRNSQ